MIRNLSAQSKSPYSFQAKKYVLFKPVCSIHLKKPDLEQLLGRDQVLKLSWFVAQISVFLTRSPFYYTVYQGLTNRSSNSTIDLELFLSYPRKFFSVVEQRNPRPGELRIFKTYV